MTSRRARFSTSAALLLTGSAALSTSVLLAACGDDTTDGAGGSSGVATHAAATTTGSPTVLLRIDPAETSIDLDVTAPAPTVSYKALASSDGGAEEDVTASAVFSTTKIGGGTFVGSVFTLGGIGGDIPVQGSYQGASGAGVVHVKLVGDVVVDGADPTLPDQFDAATMDPTPGNEPVLEYPADGVVLPANLPPIEAQWTQAADNAAYRVHLVAGSALDISFYGTARELKFPAQVWTAIAGTVPDLPVTLTVDGLGAGGLLRAGAPQTLIVSADRIDDSAIYVWQSSTGSFRVLDVTQGTDIPLPSNAPALAAGQPCSGCHRISRDGKRFAYSFNGSNFETGALRFDDQAQSFNEVIAPTAGVRGTYATFNPLEATQVPAMLLTVPDDVEQNTAGATRLQLVHPETLAPVTSNLSTALGGAPPSTMMPDWSPAGDFVVFVGYDSGAHFVRELGDDVVSASLMEMPVSYDGASQSFTFGTPSVLVAPAMGEDPDVGENNFLPSVSPDGSAVAFTRAHGWWSIKTQSSLINQSGQIMLVRRSDKQVFELTRGSNGAGTIEHSTWPQWAPTIGQKYAWIAYSSQHPYGHRLTPASPENGQCTLIQGQTQCKQLWVTAIDREAFMNGTADPSQPPFWIPGQNLAAQYVSPQWTTAVIDVPQ